MSEYYQRTLEVKKRILERPDLIERIKSLCDTYVSIFYIPGNTAFNPSGFVDSILARGDNRTIYYVSKLQVDEVAKNELHIALKKTTNLSWCFPQFDPKNLQAQQFSLSAGEAEVYETIYRNEGHDRVPFFYIVVNNKGDLHTLTEDITQCMQVGAFPINDSEVALNGSSSLASRRIIVNARRLMHRDFKFTDGLKYLSDEARLDI